MTTAFLRSDIKRDEGERRNAEGLHVAYPDPKTGGSPWTVGWGHTGLNVHPGAAWTDAQAELALTNDILDAFTELDRHAAWWRKLNDARQDVLVNMAFNMGWLSLDGKHGLGTFKRFLAAAQAGRWADARAEMLHSGWDKDVGERATRLAEQMLTGLRLPRKGDPPVTDTSTAPAPVPTKSPLQSTTLQGAMLSIACSLIPTFAKMLGVDVTGAEVAEVVGAAGTIVGFAMTVIGRMKAAHKLA